MNDTVLGMMLTASGYLSVAVFFFVSGLGIYSQYLLKGTQYVKDFPKRRLLDILIKYVVLVFIYFLYFWIITGNPPIKDFLVSFIFGRTIVVYGWYLHAIILGYLLFFLVVRFVNKKNHFIAFLLSAVAYIALCILLDLGAIWYQSFLTFYLGMFCAANKERILELLRRKRIYIIFVAVSFLLFSITLLLGNLSILSGTLRIICKMASSIAFVSFVFATLNVIGINNKITSWLGKYSFEIYVVHGLFVQLFRKIFDIDILYVISVYIISFICAVCLNKLFVLITKKIRG